MPSLSGKTFKYFYNHIKKYKLLLFSFLLLIGGAIVVSDIVVPYNYKRLVDLLTSEYSSREVLYGQIKSVLLLIFFLYILTEVILWRVGVVLLVFFETRVGKSITDDCFAKLMQHSYNFFADNFSGSLVAKVKRMTSSFEKISDVFIWHIFINMLRLVFAIAVFYFLQPGFAIVMIIWSFIYCLIVWRFFVWKMKYDLAVAEADSKLTGELADAITNSITIKLFARARYELDRFKSVTDNRRKLENKSWILNEAFAVFKGGFMAILEVGMIFYAVRLWFSGEITVGTVVLIQSYLFSIMHGLWYFDRAVKDFYSALADANEMTEILELPNEVQDIKRPEKCRISKGEVEFRDVNFAYNDEVKVFDNLNFKIKAGSKVGIVGESGAGKSTLTSLLFRFMDVNSGQILIDGQDISRIKQDDLRCNISFVPQEPILFHRSLFDNIHYGRLRTTKKEVYDAARSAEAHEFIQNSPEGYGTFVGERGIKLSGGERQRVAIARSMLKNTPILVMDEATSSLDSKSEKNIQEALECIMRDKTAIVIAHRLSTLRILDEIIVFDEGQIVERGSHDELIKKNGKYAELWNLQVVEYIK